MDLVFITGNADKAAELSRMLKTNIEHKKIDILEIQSLNLDEVVTAKATAAYQQLQRPVLVEDTSLQFKVLGNLPGPLIKWFMKELGSDGICRMLQGATDRTAIAKSAFAVHDGTHLQVFNGTTKGEIASEPRGTQGFGWDDIFIPSGSELTWGEVTPEVKDRDSMRSEAVAKLSEWLAHG